ncbi:MAG: protoporphyrinogen oxidase [Candidatus Didemnitutus sp.]|nr:protoporphyrinogen oxidase [Candidatus Didemnitutus sp.]
MNTSGQKSVAIIGAGITGMTAAYRLHERGFRVKVFERNSEPGGAIRTHHEDGWLIEAGPNSVQFGEPELKQLVTDLGLDADLQIANPLAKKRFIVRGGKFVPVPMGPGQFFQTNLFSARTKLALFTELFTRPRVRNTDVSLAEMVRSHYTQELVDYAVNPLIAGIYAGDPTKLSVKHAFPSLWEAERAKGSLARGMMAAAKARKARGESSGPAPIVSFRRGLQQLINTIGRKLPAGSLELNSTVETLIPGQPHQLIWSRGTDKRTSEFDFVVLALPAPALAQLTFGTLGERPLASLDSIVHPPVTSLFLGYKREQVAHALDGFGGLVPEKERRDVLGILFSSTLFPGRAPEGHVALTIFAGGMRQPEHARLSTPQLLSHIADDLRDLVGVTGDPVFVKHTVWPRAIPQYQIGYERHFEKMKQLEAEYPALFIGGQARDGISLPDCCKSGAKLAKRVVEAAAGR